MNDNYYLNMINEHNLKIQSIDAKIKCLKDKLNNLSNFLNQHNQLINNLSSKLNERRFRINNSGLKEKEVKFFLKYKEHMDDILNGNEIQLIISKKEDEKRHLITLINNIESDIEDLKHKKYLLEEEIFDLQYMLRKETL